MNCNICLFATELK